MKFGKMAISALFAIPLLVLGLAFFSVQPAHAQDLVPTDPAPVVEPVEQEVDVPPDIAPVEPLVDVPPLEPAPVETPSDSSVVEPPLESVVEVVAEPVITAPVIDEPAADLTVTSDGDPYYDYLGIRHYFYSGACPGGLVVPNTCDSFVAGPISGAITGFPNSVSSLVASGMVTVYVEGSATYFETVIITGPTKVAGLTGIGTWTPANTYPVIQGGVILSSLTTPFTLSGFTITSGVGAAVVIMGSSGTINLTDLTATGTGGGAMGISVDTQSGALNLKRVHADHSLSSGLYVSATAPANITITSSSFDNNGYQGMNVVTAGTISMNGVSASNNPNINAYLQSSKSISITNGNFYAGGSYGLEIPDTNIGPVTLNTVFADANVLYGIFITNKGSVTLSNVHADQNNDTGIYIDTCKWDGLTCPLSGAVSITNATLEWNRAPNLYVAANGAITLNTVVANSASVVVDDNTFLDNSHASTTAAITINNGNFSYNTYTGLHILTRGNVALNGITANYNHGTTGRGLWIDATAGTGTVTLLGTLGPNTFSSNDSHGLEILARGIITINNLFANSNGTSSTDFGVYLNNTAGTGGVVITGADIESSAGYNLYILTKGSTSLSGITDYYSGGSGSSSYGAYISNTTSASSPTVKIINSFFNYNNDDGLYVQSKGTITLTGVDCSSNTGIGTRGAHLTTVAAGGVTISKPTAPYENLFNWNGGDGLYIEALGPVSLTSLTAYYNTGNGVTVDNHLAVTPADVTLNTLYVYSNTARGLQVTSKGAIKFDIGEVYSNGSGFGIKLDNDTYTTIAKPVSLSKIKTHDNPDNGLFILTKGAVTIKTITSRSNTGGGQGVHIEVNGNGVVTFGVVSSTDTNYFDHNLAAGLYIRTGGAISLTNVESYNNGSYGADLDNNASMGSVTVTNCHFYSNPAYGLYVVNQGSISLKGGYSNENTIGGGALLDNHLAVGSPGISLTNFEFSNNTGFGVSALTKGTIAVNHLIAYHNTLFGINLDNSYSTTHSPVTMLGVSGSSPNNFSDNGNENLHITSLGAVTLNIVEASSSTAGYGALINNFSGTGGVTINSGSFNYNPQGIGLNISSTGPIKLSNIYAQENGNASYIRNGASLVTSGSVSITNGYFNYNSNKGLDVVAGGAISLTNVTASTNGSLANPADGVSLDNLAGTAGVTVTNQINNYQFYGNNRDGLVIASNGKVTLSGIQSRSNLGRNVRIDNRNGGLGTGDVIITTIWSNRAGDVCLSVISNGAISLTGATIYSCGYPSSPTDKPGAYLDNSSAGTAKSVTVSKSSFNPYRGSGLRIFSRGSVTLNGVSCTSNNAFVGLNGAYIDTTLGGTAGSVTVLNTLGANAFNNNTATGLNIITAGGAVTLNGVTAKNNSSTSYGVLVTNAGAVTMNTGDFENNTQCGLRVTATGNISLTNVLASGNTLSGAVLINTAGVGTVTVKVSKSSFTGNTQSGLSINTLSTVTLNGVHADNNDLYGAYINNLLGTGGVTFLNSLGTNTFSGNSSTTSGLYIDTHGPVSITGIVASNNGSGAGAIIYSGSTVSISSGTFNLNDNQGLYVSSNGMITLTGISSFWNGRWSDLDGLNLNTSGYDVKITNGNIIGNGKSGIYANIGALSKLVLTNVLCAGNDRYGGVPDMDVYTNGILVWN